MTSNEILRCGVIKRIITKELTQRDGAELLALSIRQIKRLTQAFHASGEQGIISKHKGGNRAFDHEFKSKVLAVVTTKYADFRPSFAAEKLAELEQLNVNRETLRQWMIEDNLWKGKRRKNAKIHQTRARRSRCGELIQIDGSHHDWFEARAAKCCLLVFIDDATSRLMHLEFVPAETTKGYFLALNSYLLKHGIPLALYSDKHGIFTVNMPDKIDGLRKGTQFQRAVKELGIESILAQSPQAKGRVERANSTLQDRLIKEMRLKGISTITDANNYMPEFMVIHNAKFAVVAADPVDFHKILSPELAKRLAVILSNQEVRTLSKNLEFSYNSNIYQIKRHGTGYALRHAKVNICELLDGKIIVMKDGKELEYTMVGKRGSSQAVVDRKGLDVLLDARIIQSAA